MKIKAKKIPYYLLLSLLTLGASVMLGFLSFGGMYVLWPIVPLALASFVLSIAYEGEIYWQNIKGALNKLFKPHVLERKLAKEFLFEHCEEALKETDCPSFFTDYIAQLTLVAKTQRNIIQISLANQDSEKTLRDMEKAFKQNEKTSHRTDRVLKQEAKMLHDTENAFKQNEKTLRNMEKALKQNEKTLRDMEKFFARQLFSSPENSHSTVYQRELYTWLEAKGLHVWKEKHAFQTGWAAAGKVISVLGGVFMSLGTIYLLVEAFTTIPFLAFLPLASWPLLIVPMAILSGTAYGLLTYNSFIDLLDAFDRWHESFSQDLQDPDASVRKKGVIMLALASVLGVLAITLTICTAGTWWSVAQETRPLFTWLGSLPKFVMGLINPIVTGISSLIFNLENTSESLEMLEQSPRFLSALGESLKSSPSYVNDRENWGQRINPFRLILKLLTPLRPIMFMGHLVSIGVTADRVPGVPQSVSALLGILMEGFEDAHYFFGSGNCCNGENGFSTRELLQMRLGSSHSHNHNLDLPTRLLNLLLITPFNFATALWDWGASQAHAEESKKLSYAEAWQKQTAPEVKSASKQHNLSNLLNPADSKKQPLNLSPSKHWKIEQAIDGIERYKETLKEVWIGSDISENKLQQLSSLQGQLIEVEVTSQSKKKINSTLERTFQAALTNDRNCYDQHRFFWSSGKTGTRVYLEKLSERLDLPQAG